MPRYFTMPFGEAGMFEGDIYRGSSASAQTYGVQRLKDKDSGLEKHLHTLSGQWIQDGWRFARKMTDQDPLTGAPTAWEEWKPLHGPGEPGALNGPVDRAYIKLMVKEDFEAKSPAGANMKDPDGFLIWLNGSTVTQPATGQQARDPWTGELLWLDPPTNTIPQLEP